MSFNQKGISNRCSKCGEVGHKAPTCGLLTDDDLLDDTSGERCRCGLRLPCNNCLPLHATGYLGRRGEQTCVRNRVG